MADYYIDGDNGDDGTAVDGDPQLPVRSLSEAMLRLYGANDDDTLHLAGTFRSSDLGTGTDNILKINTPGQRVTIKQWVGKSQAIIRNDVVIPNGSWTYGGAAGVFTYTFAAGYFDFVNNRTLPEAIASVVVNWDTIVDGDGFNSGHLVRAQSAADCATRVNSWWFEPTGIAGTNQNGAGVLKINVGTTAGGVDAALVNTGALTSAGLTIAYCRANRNGIEVGTPTYQDDVFTLADMPTINPNGTRYLTIDGIHVYLFCDGGYRSQLNGGGTGIDVGGSTVGTRSIGYGIRVSDGINCVVKNCFVKDSGYHAIMCVGAFCLNNIILDCTAQGGGCNPNAGNSIGGAFYTGAEGTGDKNVRGCVCTNFTLYKYTLLGRTLENVSSTNYAIPIQFPFTAAGASTYTTCTTNGFISHTNNVPGNKVLDVEYHNCTVTERGKKSDNTMCLGSAFGTDGYDSGAAPADQMNAAGYSVRYYDCTLNNGSQNLASGDCNVAFVRCSFNLPRAGANIGSSTGVLASSSGTQYIHYDACSFIVNLDHASGDRVGFQLSQTNNVNWKNCSVYVNGTGTNAQYIWNFINGTGGSRGKARGCIFGFRSVVSGHNLMTMGTTPTNANLNETFLDVNDCLYFNIVVPNGFPGPNTFAKWTGAASWDLAVTPIDQQAIDNSTTNPFAGGAGSTSLDLSTAAKAIRKQLPIRTDTGVNGLPYSWHYGAWQYGATGIMLGINLKRRTRRRSGFMS